MTPLKVMLVATEASGDALSAGLARALRDRLGADNVDFVGVGGARMAAEGMPSLFDISELSILGLDIAVVPRALRLLWRTARLAEAERPDVLVLVDSWAFSILLAQWLRRRLPGMPIVKYVGPQVWATRPWRARVLARAADLLLAINSFEPPYFEAEGLRTVFVGNPVFARDLSSADPGRTRAAIGAAADDPILLILPGSRPSEIRRLMRPFGDAVNRLKAERPNLHLVLPAADTVAAQVKASVADWPHHVHVTEGEVAKFDAMRAATVALACSGTVTTELALRGCPMVVAYRLGPMTYLAARILMHSPFVSLINIAAGRAIAPELLQGDCTGPKLAHELAPRLDDPDLRARQIAEQNEATQLMGRGLPDPSEVAADAVLELLTERGLLPAEPTLNPMMRR